MSSNHPSGYGYPTDPQQNPYGQQPYGQQPPPPPGYAAPPPPPPYGQPAYGQPDYGPTGYGTPGYPPPSAPQQAWPQWLTPPGPFGTAPAPGTRSLASAGDRFLARLIDFAVLIIPGIILDALLGTMLGTVFIGLLYFAYEAALNITQHGQTVGKKAMKIRVVDAASGGRPTDGVFWGRSAIYALPSAVYCLGWMFSLLDGLWLLWDKPFQQCLHDKPGRTLVVKEG